MSYFTKEITTNPREQIKTAVIVALVVGVTAFILGMRYSAVPEIVVENEVIVQSAVEEVQTEAKK